MTDDFRRCNVCEKTLPLTAFHRVKALRFGRSYTCATCANERSRLWHLQHPTAQREWYAQHREHKAAYWKKWRAENKEHCLANYSAWYKTLRGHGIVIAKNNRRYAGKLKATPRWADATAIDAIYCEAARLTETTGIPHEVDHIVPLRSPIVCGLHVAHNLQILTKTANRQKRNHHDAHSYSLSSADLR